jgi:hypothetical protein
MALKRSKIQDGQAMVEFIVTASFILIPLFLMLPLLAKYIDIQHSTIQAARYEAWEYTAWYRKVSDMPASFNVASVIPAKSTLEVQNESRQRFFSDTSSAISKADKLGWKKTSKNLMWRDHKQKDLYDGSIEGSLAYNQDTPDTIGLASTLIDVVEAIPGFITTILSAGTLEPAFTVLNGKGYHKSEVKIRVKNAPSYTSMKGNTPLFEKDLNLVFSARAAVLSDGWNAGGREHAKTEASGLVPTRVLKKPFDFVMKILSYVPFIPSSELSGLDWGHTDSEAIPPEYMDDYDETNNATECDGAGYCGYPTFY